MEEGIKAIQVDLDLIDSAMVSRGNNGRIFCINSRIRLSTWNTIGHNIIIGVRLIISSQIDNELDSSGISLL
jgi:hypothetical protein